MDRYDNSNPVALRNQLAHRLSEIKSQIAALEQEAMVIQDDLMITEHFMHVWHRAHNMQGPMANNLARLSWDTNNQRKRPKNPPREFIVEMSLKLIEDAGRPLNRQQLFDRLAAHGVHVFGKDPQMVLSTMLWRSQDQIVRLPEFGYWPKERAFPPARYVPELDGLIGVAASEPEGELEDPEENS